MSTVDANKVIDRLTLMLANTQKENVILSLKVEELQKQLDNVVK